jgi:tRNA1(Val) A37 N6-methylase TrmN6
VTITPSETTDQFHRGKFVVVQPKSSGHRSGIDAMLVAAAVPGGFQGNVADFGAGAGAAGIAVAARCPLARVTLIENDPIMDDFARRTISHEGNAALSPRLSVVEADVSLSGKARVNSGLCDRSFDFVIMNPPFNSARDRATPDALKAAAHVMSDGMFGVWLRTAAAVLKPGGSVAVIARPASLKEILAACEGRLGALRILPFHPRPSQAAIRILVTGVKGSRAGLSLEPPLVLHGETGNGFLARVEAVINGECGLFD